MLILKMVVQLFVISRKNILKSTTYKMICLAELNII